MNKQDRLEAVFVRLRYDKAISTKKEFAERIGFDKTNLSSAFNGSDKYLTHNLFCKIADAFPQFNRDWLLTGEGEMFKRDIENDTISQSDINPINEEAMTVGKLTDMLYKANLKIEKLEKENEALKEEISTLKNGIEKKEKSAVGL